MGQLFQRPYRAPAWDAARRVYVPDDVRMLISTAYVAGTDLNNRIAIVDASAIQRSGDAQQDAIVQKDLSNDVIRRGALCRAACEKARDALRKALETTA